MHAGKKNASQFTGSGLNDKDWVDPYENYRGGVPRLEQRPLPKTMDMDDGVLMHMAPQRREHAAPKGGEKRQELERFRRQQATLQGINDMSIQDSNRLGVGKKDPRARPDDQRLIKSLLPEKEGGEYKIDHTTRAKTEHSGRDFESHFSGVTFAPDAKDIDDGIFHEGRFNDDIREDRSHMGYKDGVLQAGEGQHRRRYLPGEGREARGLKPGMYDREGRRIKPGERGAAEKGQIGRGFIANESATNEGIFDKNHVNKWAAKRHESSLSGAGMKLDNKYTDDGIFDDRHKLEAAGKSQRSAMGRGIGGLMADESATNEGIFDSRHKNRFAGRGRAGNLRVGKGGMMAEGNKVDEGIFQSGRKVQGAGLDTKSSSSSPSADRRRRNRHPVDMFHGAKQAKSEYELKGRASSFQAGFMPKRKNATTASSERAASPSTAERTTRPAWGPAWFPPRREPPTASSRRAAPTSMRGRTTRVASDPA